MDAMISRGNLYMTLTHHDTRDFNQRIILPRMVAFTPCLSLALRRNHKTASSTFPRPNQLDSETTGQLCIQPYFSVIEANYCKIFDDARYADAQRDGPSRGGELQLSCHCRRSFLKCMGDKLFNSVTPEGDKQTAHTFDFDWLVQQKLIEFTTWSLEPLALSICLHHSRTSEKSYC
ncbi:hypothetical protein K440DRAFT_642112 [Wilcoxina mikolae CBS 423.85]|nr:hypothetical protein K440DRAFT_642112 [Wilcoxina mikolae CBS 423.85]